MNSKIALSLSANIYLKIHELDYSTLNPARIIAHGIPKMFCSNCGRENPDDATFCHQCGADLKAGSSGTAQAAPSTSYSSASGNKASMKIASAFKDAIDLVKNPGGFLSLNRDNDVPLNTLMINYVAILAAIPFIATLIGDLWYYSFLSIRFSFAGFAVVDAVLVYILDIVGVFVVGLIIWKLAPSFGTNTTQVRATRMAAYAFTPAFLLAIFDLFPPVGGYLTFIGLLYGLYILYLGLPIVTNTPKDKALTYVIVVVIATIIVFAVLGFIIGVVVAVMFVAALGLPFI